MKHFAHLLTICLTLVLFTATRPAASQDTARGPWQVFLERSADGARQDTLIFLDPLSGESTSVAVYGERFTAIADAVMYRDRRDGQIRLAGPDTTVRDHPFIQPSPGARRVDWLVSEDERLIAWTLTEGTDSALTTTTWVAHLDGSERRQVLVDGPRDGIRTLPLAFDPDGTMLYMDYHPDVIGELTPFRQYAGMFSVEIASGKTSMLPGEPGCFCGGDVGANRFLRLALTADLAGYDLNGYDLNTGDQRTLDALALVGFTQAGDMMIAPDGTQAVYALAQVQNFGSADQSLRTVFVLADLENGTQRALTDPVTTFVRPVSWTEENSAVLLTSPVQDGTWKITLADGELEQVAAATFIGMVE